jgi:hypothetical protein
VNEANDPYTVQYCMQFIMFIIRGIYLYAQPKLSAAYRPTVGDHMHSHTTLMKEATQCCSHGNTGAIVCIIMLSMLYMICDVCRCHLRCYHPLWNTKERLQCTHDVTVGHDQCSACPRILPVRTIAQTDLSQCFCVYVRMCTCCSQKDSTVQRSTHQLAQQ